ncbi:hypothetical protein PC116_g34937 [Phytophthora cactorum]|nr:hypothetical protein PC116_g34937 [Phytophthora cactorum]
MTAEPGADPERCDNKIDGHRHETESSTTLQSVVFRHVPFRRGRDRDRVLVPLRVLASHRGSHHGHVPSSFLRDHLAAGCAELGGIRRSLPPDHETRS